MSLSGKLVSGVYVSVFRAAEKQVLLVSRSTLPIEKWKAEQQLLQVQQFLSIPVMSSAYEREDMTQHLRNSQVLKKLGLDRSTPMAPPHRLKGRMGRHTPMDGEFDPGSG
jgi:hypothetical protein